MKSRLIKVMAYIGVVALMLGSVPSGARASPGVDFTLQPSSQTVSTGQIFTVDIQVDASTQPVDTVGAYVNFNTTYLKVVDATGNVISGTANDVITPGPITTTLLTQKLKNQVDNTNGYADISYGMPLGGTPANTLFVLGTIRFKALAGIENTALVFNTSGIRNTKAVREGVIVTGSRTGTSISILVVDTTPPTVLATSPIANATAVAVNTAIQVTFSESMNTTLTQGAFSISPTVSGSFSWAGSVNMTFTPAANLAYSTTYTVTISTAAKDLAGNSLAQAKIWSFTTGMKELASIVITPDNPFIKPTQTLPFTAWGTFTDNSGDNITASANWTSSNLGVATIQTVGQGNPGLATGVANGQTIITANITGVSDNTTLTVDGTNPSVTVSYPNGGERFGGGKTANIYWWASDTNMANNPITLEYFNGASWVLIATNEANDGMYLWTVPTLDITTARVRITAVDKAGNTGSDVSNADFTIDSTKPTIVSVSPANGATNVAVNATIQFTFSEPMNWASVQNAFSISPTVLGSLTYVGMVKTFTPSANLTYNTTYTVTVSTNATDVAGNPLAQAKVWSFTTVKQPPAVTTSTATGITTNSATLNGILTSLGSYTPVNVSFVWGTSSGNLNQETTPQARTTTGSFSANLTGLTLGTTYYFRARATANGVTVYGDILSVTTVRLVSIDINPDNPRIALGRSQQFTATGTYDNNSTGDVTNIVSWTSSNTTVAVIGLNTGLATTMGKVEGVTLITAAFGDATPDSTTLTVGPKELEVIKITPTATSVPVGMTANFTALGIYSNSSNETITANVTWVSTNPTIATIKSLGEANPGQATGMKLGETTILATQGSIKSNIAKLNVTAAVLVKIEIEPVSVELPLGKTRQFTARGTRSDNSTANITATVQWVSDNTTVASISSTGLASTHARGTARITASLSGVPSNVATITVIDPVIESLRVTPKNPSIALGTIATLPFTATTIYSDKLTTTNVTGSAIWTSSKGSVATIAPNTGLATIVGEGYTLITATYQTGGATFTDNTTLTVIAPILLSIAIDDVYPATDNVVPPVPAGNTLQLYLTGTYSGGSTANLTNTAIWSSSNTAVAVISASGLVEGKAFGTANITATHTGLRKTATITVIQPPAVAANAATEVAATSARLNGSLVSLGSASSANASFEWGLTAAYGNETAPQRMTSTDAFSASLSGLISNTTYHFRAKAAGDGTSYSGDLTFTTGKLPPTVTTGTITNITSSSATINGTLTDLKGALAADVSLEWGLTTAYDNETTSVSMDSTGNFSSTLSNLAPSTTYHFRAKAVGFGTSYGADKTFTTLKALVSIEVTPTNPSVAKGKTVLFTATGIYSNGDRAVITANWISSKDAVATIAAGGLATSRGIGTTTITATDPATSKSGNTTLTVTEAVLEAITVTPKTPTPSVAAGDSLPFSANGTYSDGTSLNITTSVIWTSSDTNIASIEATTGLATGRNVSTVAVTITATKESLSDTASLQVTEARLTSIQVSPSAPVTAPLQEKQFNAIGIYSDGRMDDITTRVLWASSDNTVATITAGGSAKSLVAGTANITATLGTIPPGRTTLIVRVNLISITISVAAQAIPSGRAERFTATGTYTDGTTANITKEVTWSSSNETTARINQAGVATSFAPGTTGITASLAGKTSSAITLTVTDPELAAVRIRPANPRITRVSGTTQTLQFTATGIYSEGSSADNTTTATWTSSDPTVAEIGTNTGLVVIKKAGTTTITVTLLTASSSTKLTVLSDTVAPVVTLTSPTEGLSVSDKTLTVTGKVDDISANTTVIVNGILFPVTLDVLTGAFSQDVLLNISNNIIQVRAIDDSGNTGTSSTITVIFDPKKPKITITSPASGKVTNKEALTVIGNITDNVTSATLIFNGVSTGVRVEGGGFSANVTLLDEVNIIVVNAGEPDFLGTSGIVTVTLDRTAPPVIIESPVSGSVTNNRLGEVSGTIGDPLVPSVVITVNNISETVSVLEGRFSRTVTLQPGLNTITVEATDEAGNTSTVTTTITLDTSVPGVIITRPTNKLLTNTAAQIVTGNVTDLSLTTAKLILNGREQGILLASDGSFSQAITLALGVNRIEVTVTDTANNTGTSGVVSVELDNIAPVVTIGLSTPTESILITVTTNEPLPDMPTVRITGITSAGVAVAASVNMTVADVNKWSVSYGSKADPITAGEYAVTVTGTDSAGNAATVTATFAKKTISVTGDKPTIVTTPTTTLRVETDGDVTDTPISVTQHLFNPSGDVKKPKEEDRAAGAFVEIITSPELINNLKRIYIQVEYDPDELPPDTDLKLYLWDVASGTWQVVPGSGPITVDGRHYIAGYVRHLSKYGGFGTTRKKAVTIAEAPGVSDIAPVTVSGLSATPRLRVNSEGVVQETSQLKSLDDKATLDIPKGTKLLDTRGNPLDTFSYSQVVTPPAPPSGKTIVLVVDFGPAGATFAPAITLTMSYEAASLPSGVSPDELYIAYWDGSQWLALASTVDTKTNTVSAKISHFTQFAIISKLPPALPPSPVLPPPVIAPASFAISDISVTPSEVKPAEQVTISAVVTNTGGSEGSYTVVLKVNGVEEARKEITLGADQSETVSFTIAKDTEGSYTVDINGKVGQFTVTAPPPSEPEMVPELPAKPPTNWALIWGIVGGVIILGLILWLAVFRRRTRRA